MKIIFPCKCYGSFILLSLLLLCTNICSSDFSTESWKRAILPFQYFIEYCIYLQLYTPNKKHAASKNLPLVKFCVFCLVVYCRVFVINYSHLQPDFCNFHNTTKKKKVYLFLQMYIHSLLISPFLCTLQQTDVSEDSCYTSSSIHSSDISNYDT